MDVKEIPGTMGFKASKDGNIFGPNDEIKNQYTNLDGYKTASVLRSNGKWQTFGVHRLIALAHIPYNSNLNKLTVNHKDGIVSHNVFNNLEWVTVAKNNIHAILLRGSKERPVILAKSPEGRFEFISNLQTASKRFNCDIDLIWESIRDNRLLNGWKLMHHGKGTAKPKELHLPKMVLVNNILAKRPIKVLNIETQHIEEFNSIGSAALKYNTSPSLIYKTISCNGKKKLFYRKYLIVDKDNEFPSLSQSEYENLLAPSGKIVIAYNTNNKTRYIYESASKFINDNKLSKKAVTVDLKKNRLRLLNGWWYLYNNTENIKRLSGVIGCPDSIT